MKEMKPALIEEPDEWINSAEVRKYFGNVSYMSLYRWQKDKGFPPPVAKYSGRNYWSRARVLSWRASLMDEAE
jgi:predicted DNA-binding transcriptional regulator AlpA